MHSSFSLNFFFNKTFSTLQPDVEKDEEVTHLKETLIGRFEAAAAQVSEHRDQFLQHQSLWRDRRAEVLEKFLTSEEGGKQPGLPKFRQQVTGFILKKRSIPFFSIFFAFLDG